MHRLLSRLATLCFLGFIGYATAADKGVDREAWREFAGQAGATGWRVHVIHPDPNDHGPDGFNAHDWDGDGHLDVLVNYEEGAYSRLYFNPGPKLLTKPWEDFIQFDHGKCEDSAIGDLDNDGDIDYIAKGNIIFFNPGPHHSRNAAKWIQTNIGIDGGRSPVVADLDGDGKNDLIVSGLRWARQPKSGATDGKNWSTFEIGKPLEKSAWPMSVFAVDIDDDQDLDILLQDRKAGTYYFVNPGRKHIEQPWERVVIDEQKQAMFMTIGDVNADGQLDLVRSGKGVIDFFLGKNDSGKPDYHVVSVPVPSQPGSKKLPKPKGVALLEINGDDRLPEIVIVPEYSAQLWSISLRGDGSKPEHWITKLFGIPGAKTRKKMDNTYLADIDGDGDLDVATTEENGGWGVIWFENPLR